MVDMDKHVCHQLAENGYRNGQWPESYITWEFLADHPRAMESGYFHVDWNSIPRLYNWKSYLRMLVIEKKEWDHLSNPAQLKHYSEPTQDYNDFHWTLGLALCWTPFHDCFKPGCCRAKTGTAFRTTIYSSCGGALGGRQNDSHTSTCSIASEIPALSGHLL